MKGAIEKAEELAKAPEQLYPGSVCKPGESTGSSGHDGPEIYEDTDEGRHLCGGVGTGDT